MAFEVGRLIVEIEARTRRLRSGLRNASLLINGFVRGATIGLVAGLGGTLTRLARRFIGLGGIIAAAAGAFSFAALIRGAITAASEIDQFEIRLQNLIGSQEETNFALQNLRDFATRVAPSLRDLIGAAATLGTVALGSARRIETLVGTAANIQAITGLTLTQSAENLQRALSAGIGAADLFRERGVRALLEALTGIPNLIDAPISEVSRAFDEVFGPNGTFGNAAEQFATTLPGAISVAGDALFNFRAAVGEALSPAITAFIQEVFIPQLNRLTRAVEGSEVAIAEFARRGVIALVNSLSVLARALVAVTRFFGNFGSTVRGVLGEIFLGLRRTDLALNEFFARFGLTERARNMGAAAAANLRAEITGLESAIDDEAAAVGQLDRELDALTQSIIAFQAASANLGQETVADQRAAAAAAEETLGRLRELFAAASVQIDARLQRQVTGSINRQVRLLDQRARREAGLVDPIRRRLSALDQESEKLRTNLDLTTGVRDRIAGEITALTEQIPRNLREQEFIRVRLLSLQGQLNRETIRLAEVTERTNAALADNAALIQRATQRMASLTSQTEDFASAFGAGIGQLERIDPEEASNIVAQLSQDLENAGGIEAVRDAFRKASEGVVDGLDERRAEIVEQFDFIGDALQNTIVDALVTGAQEGGIEFAETLAELSGTLLRESLTNVLDDLGGELSGFLEQFDFTEAQAGRISQTIGTGLGLAGSILSNALRDTEARVSDQVQSVVDSAQALRGVVVGPSDVPIFQVSGAIRDAFIPIEGILLESLEVQRQIAAQGGAGGIAGVGSEEALDDTLAGEINSSPSLI